MGHGQYSLHHGAIHGDVHNSLPLNNGGASFSLALTDSVDPAPAGNNFTYTASVNNIGTGVANSVSLVITLDASLTYVSSSGTGWTTGAVGQVVTCTRATLNTGAAPNVTITVTAGNSAGSISSSATVSASNASLVSTSQGTTITQLTQTVVVTDSLDPVITGQSFAYTVQVHNSGLSGSGTANTLSCAVTLDSSLTYVSSSGTGWSIGVSGQVVTATLASLAVGDANPITINVTAGNSALTASTSASLTASNAVTATGSQNTTVGLVTQDATSLKYMPQSTTEWTNFLAYAGLAIGTPKHTYLLQQASGNASDVGSGTAITLTAAGWTYQQSLTGWTTKGVTCADNASATFSSTSTSLPDISSTDALLIIFAAVTSTPAATRSLGGIGSSTTSVQTKIITSSGTKVQANSGANSLNGSTVLGTTVVPFVMSSHNHTCYSLDEKLVPTLGTQSGKSLRLGGLSNNSPALFMLAAYQFEGTDAQLSDAQIKTLQQKLGFTVNWS